VGFVAGRVSAQDCARDIFSKIKPNYVEYGSLMSMEEILTIAHDRAAKKQRLEK
jgi:hypothetical protein